jgi:hypothetical protein
MKFERKDSAGAIGIITGLNFNSNMHGITFIRQRKHDSNVTLSVAEDIEWTKLTEVKSNGNDRSTIL